MRAHKLRTFLTLLGVMAGVATVIMMVSFVVGFNNPVTRGLHHVRHPPRAVPEVRAAFRRVQAAPEEERNRRDLTIEDALALKRLSKLVAAVSQERYLFEGTSAVKAGRLEANSPLAARRQPGLLARRTTTSSRTAASSPTPTCATRRGCA